MKILILANSDMGLYKFRRELLQRLLKEDNQIFISLPDGPYIPLLIKMGCVFLCTPLDRRGTNPRKDLALLCRYAGMMRRIKPDTVLTYTIKPNIYGGIACQMHHITYLANVTGMGTAMEKKGVLSKILLFLYQAALRKASQIFFQNEENKRYFEEKGIVSRGRLIPGSGVDLMEHCYEDYPEEDGFTRFLFVGRIMKDKGIEEFLDCAEQIGGKYANVCFDLIGEYEEEHYKKKVAVLEKKGRIRYLGVQDDVHAFIKNHHAVILPSYHEGLSNVLLEAAACGRPVLATTVPGCRETYEDGISGIGFLANDSSALVKAVEKFLKMPYGERRLMGINGRQKAEKEFDREIVIEAYRQEIYRKRAEESNEYI